MTVLLVSPFFHPEAISTGRYNTALAQELVNRGAQVEVLASHPLYPLWQPERSDAQLPGMRITRGGGWLRYPRMPVLRRLVLEIWFAQFANLRVLWRRGRASRVVVVFPPSIVALALRACMPRKALLIGIVHDLQGVMSGSGHSAGGRAVSGLVRAIEGRALSRCDRLVFLSHSMAERAIGEYALRREACSIHYPFLTLPAAGPLRTEQLAAVLPDGCLNVVYSGALGEKQEPDQLAALMRALAARHPDVRCHIFSAGPHFDRLQALAKQAGDTTIGFHPLVPEEVLDELLARSTLQLLPQASGTSDGAIPSKLPNLIAAGVPVFAICDEQSEIVRLLRQAGEEAGDHAAGFDAPDLHAKFAALLARTAHASRAARIARHRPIVENLFSVGPLVTEILSG